MHNDQSRRDRPILFQSEMVRALLAGAKTQTRRVLANPEFFGCPTGDCPHDYQGECNVAMQQNVKDCPYGKVGDLLWVREGIDILIPEWNEKRDGARDGAGFLINGNLKYLADSTHVSIPGNLIYDAHKSGKPFKDGVKPGIHMWRWANRLTLEVTAVRLEQLQSISLDDAMAEGWREKNDVVHPQAWYEMLWCRINGEQSWKDNPWVWVVEFKVHKRNVDLMPKIVG